MEETTELIDKYAMQIVDAVKQAAPEVWSAAYRYAIAGCIGWGLLSALVLVGCAWFWRWAWARRDDWDDVAPWTAAYVVTVFAALIATGGLIDCLTSLIALDWLAIQNIVRLVKP